MGGLILTPAESRKAYCGCCTTLCQENPDQTHAAAFGVPATYCDACHRDRCYANQLRVKGTEWCPRNTNTFPQGPRCPPDCTRQCGKCQGSGEVRDPKNDGWWSNVKAMKACPSCGGEGILGRCTQPENGGTGHTSCSSLLNLLS